VLIPMTECDFCCALNSSLGSREEDFSTAEIASSGTFSRPVSRVSALDTGRRNFHIDIAD
jgi:hypothetical protein